MLHEFSFLSVNGRDQVQAWLYIPAAEPKGIIQLVHGFGEHSRRYLRLTMKMNDAGYIVAADDHVGHGKTAIMNDTWGNWGTFGPHTMTEDEHTLYTMVHEKYPDLPYFMFGHSMGSFIARDYIAAYGDTLTGVTLCGTSGTWPNLDKAIAALQKLVDEGKGSESDPSAAGIMMGGLFARIGEEVKLGNEWICHDPYVQKDHAEDPFDAFTKPTSNLSFLFFAQMIEQITGLEWAKKVPGTLAIYNIAGDQDPVGQFGQGVYETTNWLMDTGHTVTTKLYSGYRHEIHNYNCIRDEVAQGIIDFFDQAVKSED